LSIKDVLLESQKEMSDATAEQRARFLLYRRLSSALRSPAVPFVGLVMAVAPVRDASEAARNLAIQEYSRDRESAVARGLTTPDGVPLDTREYLVAPTATSPGRRNPNFGKPIKPFLVRSVILIGRKKGTKDLKLIHLLLRGNQANLQVPEGICEFRANLRDEDESKYVLTSSTSTMFTPAIDAELKRLDFATVFETAPEEFVATLSTLKDKHDPDDQFRVVFVEADVVNISDVPTQTGAYVLSLSDETLPLDAPTVPMFTPKELFDKIDFGVGTRVRIIGRTTQVGDAIGILPFKIVPVEGLIVTKDTFSKVVHIEEEEGE